MVKKEVSDDELIMMINEDESSKDILYSRYKGIVDICVNKYKKMAYSLGMDLKDLNQEALVGFSDALKSYNQKENASIKTFISLCVERRLQTAIVKASRKKNLMLNNALSLEHIYQCFDSTLADIISDNNENDPLTKMTREEHYNKLVKDINDTLSENEKDVFNLMLDGLNYQEIATILNINPKSIDNTIQRIKQKIKNLIEINK